MSLSFDNEGVLFQEITSRIGTMMKDLDYEFSNFYCVMYLS